MGFKYNTNVELGDYSGSIWVSVYDSVAEKLFGVSALRLKEIKQNENEYEQFMSNLYYKPFHVGIEIKSEKFILRNIDQLKIEDFAEWSLQSVKNIAKLKQVDEPKISE